MLFVLGITVFIWGVEGLKVPAQIASQIEAGRQNAFLNLIPGQKTKVGEEKQVEEAKPIKFAIFSDIHSDLPNLQKAVDLVKKNSGEFIIVTGDLTTVGKKSELSDIKKILDQSKIEYYVVPGNHDNWTGNQLKKDLFLEVFGKRYQSFYKDGQIKFILIDNGAYEGVGKTEEGWIKEQVEECPKIVCLVFMHMPLNHPDSLHIMGEDNPKVGTQAGELVKLFARDKIEEVFTGHLHFSSSYEIGGFKTDIVGSLATDRNFQSPKFMEVVIKDGKIEQKKEIFLQ